MGGARPSFGGIPVGGMRCGCVLRETLQHACHMLCVCCACSVGDCPAAADKPCMSNQSLMRQGSIGGCRGGVGVSVCSIRVGVSSKSGAAITWINRVTLGGSCRPRQLAKLACHRRSLGAEGCYVSLTADYQSKPHCAQRSVSNKTCKTVQSLRTSL